MAAETVVLRRSETQETIWRLSVANSLFGRFRGLMGRRALAAGEGLYLPGTNSIHMLFMRFPIDCIFLGAPRSDGAQPIVAVRSCLRPWTSVVWWIRGARGAVEVPAGAAEQARLRVGDDIKLEPE